MLSGPINSKRKKADLVEIADAVGVDSTGTVKDLVSRITTFIKEHSNEIAADARLQGLTSYRSTVVSSTAASKESGKTSADKAHEDAIEEAKANLAVTGSVLCF